jgi:cytochrome c biogenesis protein CcmG, thiol:disulfide interchange protein DsbE
MTRQRAGRRPPPPRQGPRSSTLVLGIGALVIAVSAIAAIVLTQSGATPSGAPSASTFAASRATVTGVALPAFADGTDDPAIGAKAPEVVGTAFDGTPATIKADGRAKLILFIAHWCPHCQREVPVVQAWIDAKRLPADVDLVSVATAIDPTQPNYPPDAWLAREHWTPSVIVDGDGQVATDYGLSAFPYWVAVSADGTVVERTTGELTPEQLDALVAAVAPG